MVRINLLPPEIIERRIFEKRFAWVLLGGAVAFALIAVVWMFFQWQVSQKNSELQQNLATYQQVQAQAEAFKVFELKESELAAVRSTADKALAARVDWARITNEISLILPPEAWVTGIEADEAEGLSMAGHILDSPTDIPDAGHKAVAKLLFRLADLELIDNVWLTSSVKSVDSESETTLLDFDVSTGLKKPAAPAATSSVPAPPAQSTQ
ncbi:MAG: PilN domain-containing protein [Coriobacteriia bacterium]